MRNVRLTSAAILAFAVIVAACAPAGPAAKSPSSGQPKRGGTLILARSGEVTNLDPHKVPAFTSARVFELVYSYLMRLDDSLGVQSDLAASMPRTSPAVASPSTKLAPPRPAHVPSCAGCYPRCQAQTHCPIATGSRC